MPASPSEKYQVFISSTFDDLREERQAVTWSLLKLRHIPVGMENLTAGTDRGWETIQDLIDNTDYYVLILAGRYGSVDLTTNKSWTQMEYEYALSRGVPILAFIRRKSSIPLTKFDAARAVQLEAFIATVTGSGGHLAEWWDEREDLATAVTTALSIHIREDERRNRRRPGWWRGAPLGTTSISASNPTSQLGASPFARRLQAGGATGPVVTRFAELAELFRRGARIDRNQVETDLQAFADNLPYEALLALNDEDVTKSERVCAAIAISYHSKADTLAWSALHKALVWAQGEGSILGYRILSAIRRLINRNIDATELEAYAPTFRFFSASENRDVSTTAHQILVHTKREEV